MSTLTIILILISIICNVIGIFLYLGKERKYQLVFNAIGIVFFILAYVSRS